ncbi:heme ABC exporter ATP-binding protein CcmA [Sandarakinorhabdus sp.]|uniref:heme ABC exporter ATP-binding protein CcmA n=1 Tax=Sandarakinorhabdus sp. TaxID=1916663 RepID=UPI00286E1D41|nr:heme ABC exporter ATP-binding protein CcmA [Sandarakinorhabdus sp.]
MTNLLAATDLACRRGDRLLFEHLSFGLESGGALHLEGPNGSGKSSLLRLIAGLLAPEHGTITGNDSRAYLGHDVALKPRMQLSAELGHWARLDGANERLPAAMAAMNVTALAGLPSRHLSSGQRRRAGLARVIASGAPLWLLDEPTAGLDTASCGLLADAMAQHRAAGGMIVAAVHGPIGLACPQTVRLG